MGSISRYLVSELKRKFRKGEMRELAAREDAEVGLILPESALSEGIAFCHDLGHPPFGHSGERALDSEMRAAGGFEGNGQTLRILTYPGLEESTRNGFELTRRTMLGVVKYPVLYPDVCVPGINGPPKCCMNTEREALKWILEALCEEDRKAFTATTEEPGKHRKSVFKSFDASVMELADDIAYGVHDIEDGIELGYLKPEEWRETYQRYEANLPKGWWTDHALNLGNCDMLTAKLFGCRKVERKWAVGGIVNALVLSVRVKSVKAARFHEPLVKYNAYLGEGETTFLTFLLDAAQHMIKSPEVQEFDLRGSEIVTWLFKKRLDAAAGHDKRGVCDEVASMTDTQAAKAYSTR